ncbi:AAA family ATPase [Chryseobacterium sp. JM1]|uniref:AAA family ATPase n=1 Tax=Chryseobacterium sp. JM1 TaxID=1233950 RepID=UPI0004E6E9BC|nr:AAA family ATPase [Chryseobacterium sp. JM1]KFF17017.1 hypothetical protein IW22_21770 [Chryseobacterium sp. JM1]
MNQHIQNIEISNFKSIKDLKIDGCKKINIFAGKPNAGKSNILEAISMLRLDIIEDDFREYLRFKNYDDLTYFGNIENNINITSNLGFIDFEAFELFGISYLIGNKENMFKINIDDENYINIFHGEERGFPKNYKPFDYNILLYKHKEYINKKFFYNKRLNVFGRNLGEIIYKESTLNQKKLFDTIAKLVPENFKIKIDSNNYELTVSKEITPFVEYSLPYSMIAETLQRLIFYKAAIITNNDSVLLFEEPEAHCFEPYILEFTNEVKYNENNNQFFMVTHSDFIIQEFLRDEESKDNLQIYLVNNVDGKTEVKKLDKLNNDEVYEYGMNVFFNFDNLWENN